MTIKEIAKLAGVSVSTVSKIVNNKDQSINSKTRSRVLEIVKEYNYTPYGNAKSLSNAKSFLIGVLLRDGNKPSLILNGLLEIAQEKGYSLLLLDSRNSTEAELKNITSICKNKVDGVIWEPVSDDSYGYEHYFNQQGIVTCYINTNDLTRGLHIDFAKMGYAMTQKLMTYKHEKIGCLLKKGSYRSQMIFKGFQKCLFDHQISYHQNMALYISDPNYCSKILAGGFSGILSSHFASALALFEQMDKMHYYIPSDFSLISLSDDIRDAITYPPISNIPIPYKEFGYYAGKILIDRCEKKANIELDSLFSANLEITKVDSLDLPSFLRPKKVVVVGSINTDITFNVDMLPQTGKTTSISNSTTTLGGKGANQAVGVAKLGHEVCLIGEIGNDIDSDLILDTLKKESVSTKGIHRTPNIQTGKAYIYIERDGESTISILAGANDRLAPKSIYKRAHLFHNAGFCLLATEIPIDAVLAAATTAKHYGAKTIVKPAAAKTIPTKLYQSIDIFIPNRKEAASLCPQHERIEDQADFFYSQGPGTVIITLGHQGCYLKDKDTTAYFPAPAFSATDTTGGADAFIAAFSTYLTRGYGTASAIQIALFAAGFCVTRLGVVPALIDRNTLENHIKSIMPDLL